MHGFRRPWGANGHLVAGVLVVIVGAAGGAFGGCDSPAHGDETESESEADETTSEAAEASDESSEEEGEAARFHGGWVVESVGEAKYLGPGPLEGADDYPGQCLVFESDRAWFPSADGEHECTDVSYETKRIEATELADGFKVPAGDETSRSVPAGPEDLELPDEEILEITADCEESGANPFFLIALTDDDRIVAAGKDTVVEFERDDCEL